MAEIYAVKGESLAAVADAIREKTGATDALGLSEMPGAIRGIPSGSGSYDEGFAAGKQAEYDRFWDGVQDSGNRTNYKTAFSRWNLDSFYPKYDITPTGNAAEVFFGSLGEPLDLTERLKECGVTLDTSLVTDFNYAFYNRVLTRIPRIDTTGASAVNYIAPSTTNLVTIDELVLKEDGSQTFVQPFDWSTKLENLTVSGKIGQNGFSVNGCNKLTHDSLMSIINALMDYSGTGETRSVTLGTPNLAKLTDAEKMMAVNKGWTLVGWTPPEDFVTCPTCGAVAEPHPELAGVLICPNCGDF